MECEFIERLKLIRHRIEEFNSLGKEDSEFLLKEAIKNSSSVRFRGVVKGAAPKSSSGGVFELKLELSLAEKNVIHTLLGKFNEIVTVSVDPDDGQARLAGEDGIPLEDEGLFDDNGNENEEFKENGESEDDEGEIQEKSDIEFEDDDSNDTEIDDEFESDEYDDEPEEDDEQ